ncbi:hypothetical protein [Streptomyces globosus]|uniref:hypothetical protein n=1 Tax=Streptomyces globosus TaxID=68209 RepID=UPI0013B3618A|nr:hypothetical protein [Streptomyces globosus]
MEELVYVAGRVVKGVAGLAYAFGDFLVGAVPDGSERRKDERRRDQAGDAAAEER